MESPALRVARLTKRYRTAEGYFEAVSDVSFEVARGECFGLLGPNGAGKTTAIQCICGFYPPSAGEITIEGWNVHTEPRRARLGLGVCAQEDTLDSDFRVLDQLVRYATFFRIPVAEGARRAHELLERFGIADKAEEQVETLSGGMKRRLQVARALISRPRVLVLDEPTPGLDPAMRHGVWNILMEERGKGVAILLCTHNMEEAERLCDRVAMMSQGRLVDLDSPTALVARHMGAAPVEEQVRPGVVWRRAANLEDVYLKVTGTRLQAGSEGA
jgi:lipooligosaccharide transport system ATP-binding protein